MQTAQMFFYVAGLPLVLVVLAPAAAACNTGREDFSRSANSVVVSSVFPTVYCLLLHNNINLEEDMEFKKFNKA